MSEELITDNRNYKGDALPVEADLLSEIQENVEQADEGDYTNFLLSIWKSDTSRPGIYQRKTSSADWMHRLEPDLQDKIIPEGEGDKK